MLDKDKKPSTHNVIYIFIFLLILILAFVIYRYVSIEKTYIKNSVSLKQLSQPDRENSIVLEQSQRQEEITQIFIKDTDIVTDINGQSTYVSLPQTYMTNDFPSIVVYGHGANVAITDNLTSDYMQKISSVAKIFTAQNYIFIASNQHGDNWGNKEAITDTYLAINWVQTHYDTSNIIYLLGYSMGGLVTLNFAKEYANTLNIRAIALLAPTVYDWEWKPEMVERLNNVEICIWHSPSDYSVHFENSTQLQNYFAKYGKEITLVRVTDDHLKMEQTRMEDVKDFFNKSRDSINR
ncbi:alpha/beta hydrolase [bacterium]|nr:alpha/beta hydrolase [bacterium]